MAYRERQKISQMTPKGANLAATDLIEISELVSGSYVTKSITGQEIINASGGGTGTVTSVGLTTGTSGTDINVTNSPITTSGDIALNIPIANATNTGKLSSTDWTTFNNKGNGTVTSVNLTMPSAFTVSGNPITTSGTLAVTGAGVVSQYVRGDGSLANFPSVSGGGASTSYYLNGSVSQGTIGGVDYYEMNKTPILGTGTDFIRTNGAGNGYIASFLTDANDPNLLKIPGGNWNLEFYFSASSSGSTPSFYVELYKYDGSTFTLIASNSANPEIITNGTSIDAYFTALSVPETVLVATDRLAIRVYVTTAGRTITLHTEDNHLCQVITTFTTGLTALNGLTDQVQNFAVGQSGSVINWSSVGATHTLNVPIKYTIELIDALTVDFYAPYNLSIGSVTNILNSPTITIQDDGVAYTLGNTIASGSRITITANTASVVTLNVTRI
jgi:hypothetical protein